MSSLWAITIEPPNARIWVLVLVAALVISWVAKRRVPGVSGWRDLPWLVLRIGSGLALLYCALMGVLWGLGKWLPEFALSVTPAWPWPLIAVMALSLFWTILTTYPARIAHLSRWSQRVMLTARLVAATLLILSFLRPGVQWSLKHDRSGRFVILFDTSRSMGTKDGAGGRSRFETEWQMLQDNRPALTNLAKQLNVSEFAYDEGLKAWPPEGTPPTEAPPLEGKQTAIGFTLDTLLKNNPEEPVVGVLLMGDFAQRALAPIDQDPRLVAQRLAEGQIPLYTVPFGASSISASGLDLQAEDLLVSPTVFVKNQVIVGAKVRASGAAGRDLTVRLLLEQPGSAAPGVPGKMEVAGAPVRIRATGKEALLPVELSFIPQVPGEYKLTVEALPLDGELVTANNQITTYLTVLKGGLSVAYFDTTRFEIKPIQRVSESPDIQLDLKLVRYGERFPEFHLEPEWFEPGRYDVYIIGDVPAQVFSQPGAAVQPLESIRQAVDRGAGLLMLGGFHSFGAGGYADTPIGAILPVHMNPADKLIQGQIDPKQHLVDDQIIVPTPLGLQHFVMRLDSPDKNLAHWQSLPPLKGANRFAGLKPLAQVLATNPNQEPLLVAQDYGRGRTMAFAGDTTWRWMLHGQGDDAQRFWRQMILWLAHKEQQSDSNVWLRLTDRRFRPGQTVDMTFGAKNAENVPLTDVQYQVQIYGPQGKPVILAPQQVGNEMSARFQETQMPGEYTAFVAATQKGTSIGSARARFIVYEHDLELHNPAADPALAAELAQTTGGRLVPPEELSGFLAELAGRDLRPDRTRPIGISLWDNWLFLLLFVTMMTVEWFFRKSRGLV